MIYQDMKRQVKSSNKQCAQQSDISAINLAKLNKAEREVAGLHLQLATESEWNKELEASVRKQTATLLDLEEEV